MTDRTREACDYVSAALAEVANPEKAAGMQAYMKTDMPFYGVPKPGRVPILRHLVKEFPPEDRDQYEELILALWALPHREEKYLAQGLAVRHKRFIVPDSLPLYKIMIVEGAWWDLVDEAATHMIRPLVINYPGQVWSTVDPWIDDEDMWLRRTAIICQVGAKENTDPGRLFRFCASRMHEEEFFIRKAIGWALREYAKTDGPAVARFANRHRDDLSGLSFREATKHIQDLLDP
ncbi:MAG: DNA alkylation repair protein [Actinomycetota bacterium]|nr:DNA alkylation repair protein [Actinomycetota bacterium]